MGLWLRVEDGNGDIVRYWVCGGVYKRKLRSRDSMNVGGCVREV